MPGNSKHNLNWITNTFFSQLGYLIQRIITTNVPAVIITNLTNIFYHYKVIRSLFCLAVMMAGGAGGAALALLMHLPYHYLADIVTQTLPFLGEIGIGIGVGVIGFWLGAACAYNLAKSAYREFARVRGGHTNVAYHLEPHLIKTIIDKNPQIFQLKKGSPLLPMAHFSTSAVPIEEDNEIDVEANEHLTAEDPYTTLYNCLNFLVRKIDEFKKAGNKTEHKRYKEAFNLATRRFDLEAVFTLMAENKARRKVARAFAAQTQTYLNAQDPTAIIFSHQLSRIKERNGEKNRASRTQSTAQPLSKKSQALLIKGLEQLVLNSEQQEREEKLYLPTDSTLSSLLGVKL